MAVSSSTNSSASASASVSQCQWELLNAVETRDDAIFNYDERAHKANVEGKPWLKEFIYSN